MLTRPPRGRPCQTPCSYVRRSRCPYTLLDQNHDSVFFSFWSIKPTMLTASMLTDCSTSASSMPSCLPRRTDLLRNSVLIMSLLDLFFIFFFFGPSYRPSCPPRCSDTTLCVHLQCPLNFSSSLRSIGSLLPIGRYSTSLRSARL
jgi:hypothetical protein